jgi:cysteine desulfurase
MRREIYLDNNATTMVHRSVTRVMTRALKSLGSNPSSLYQSAHRSRELLEDSRAAIAEAIGAAPHEIILTGSASEANNQALVSLFEDRYPERKIIISSPIEHPSIISTLEYLATKGAVVRYIPVSTKGIIDMDEYCRMLDDEIISVCCMLANNETGSVQDIQEMARRAHERNIPFICDCVQALGKIPVNVKMLGVDYATFSAHKIHGPKGSGALYAREGLPVIPLIHGGHQENALRAGTESLHNIAGFAQATRLITKMIGRAQEITSLRRYFLDELQRLIPNLQINTPLDASIPNTLSITLPGIDNAMLIAVLDYYGICVSAGSACSTPDNKASHVLTAIGLTEAQARQSIRISLGDATTRRQLRRTINVIRRFIGGKTPSIGVINPAMLPESELFDERTYILDVRFWHERIMYKSLPRAHEASYFMFYRYLKQIPRNKHIIVVCQGGFYSPIIGMYLKKKGYHDVSFIVTGLEGWKAAHAELYRKYAGVNVIRLNARRSHALLSS